MKVGDYVRTRDGRISIIEDIDRNGLYILKDYDYSYKNDWLIKSSPNIIDLIEVGDYVNGAKIISKYKEYIEFYEFDYIYAIINGEKEILYNNDIKSIITHEQIESMEYTIESEVN